MEAWVASSFVLAGADALETLSFDVQKKGELVEMATLGRQPVAYVGKHSACTVQL